MHFCSISHYFLPYISLVRDRCTPQKKLQTIVCIIKLDITIQSPKQPFILLLYFGYGLEHKPS